MKKIYTIVIALFLSAIVFAQAPQKMSYQAVIRDASNNLVTSHSVGMKISILQGSATGTVVYTETQTPTTNANGLVSIEFGDGTGFSSIDWSTGSYFIQTEIDPTGGTNYTITGTSQLLSVPYALYAKTADKISGTLNELDPQFNSSIAKDISSLDTTNWNHKLSNYSETDPFFNKSIAKNILATDTANWNHKLSKYVETQNLSDVLAINNSAKAQIKNVVNPTDSQDVATKVYVDILEQKVTVLSYKFELYKGTSLLSLIQSGAKIKDLIDAGVSVVDLINAGVNISDILKAGATINGISGKHKDERDSNLYNFVGIGNQVWMSQNMAYLPKINKVKDGSEDIISAVSSKDSMCYYVYGYDDTIVTKAKTTQNYKSFGVLYNWNAAVTACPNGWHLSSSDDWDNLISFLGYTDSGIKLKSVTGWNAGQNGTNNVGFSILPAGERSIGTDGSFTDNGNGTRIWTSSVLGSINAQCYYSFNGTASAGYYNKYDGYSVRCIKN